MSSHTHGPWHITAMAYRYDEHSENVRMLRVVEPSSAADVIIITGENGGVCEIVRGNMGVGPMAVGDARLIAAAPELLETLKLARKYVQKAMNDSRRLDECAIPVATALNKIDRVIQGAEGV